MRKYWKVAVGPGKTLLEIVKRVDKNNIVYGVDISPKMLQIATDAVNNAGYSNIELCTGDARHLRFEADTFDLLYNGYMLDLIPLDQLASIILEFKRVLKPGGKLALLNMSKKDGSKITFREKLFRRLPAKLVLYLVGGCRPVLMEEYVRQAGFHHISREFIDGPNPSEIVIARK